MDNNLKLKIKAHLIKQLNIIITQLSYINHTKVLLETFIYTEQLDNGIVRQYNSFEYYKKFSEDYLNNLHIKFKQNGKEYIFFIGI